jgi:hypothetical protein
MERRRSERIRLMSAVHGQVVPMDVDITLRDISLGGLTVVSPIQLPPGATHEFRLTLGDGSPVHLRGRIAHCRRSDDGQDPPRFIVGVMFVDESDRHTEGAAVVRRITSQ